MSLQSTRRRVLQAAGIAAGAGLAGCGSDAGNGSSRGGGTITSTSGTTTYGIAVYNTLTPEDFEHTQGLDGPTPVTVSMAVGTLAPGEEPFFETTTEVSTGETEAFAEAFTVEPDGPTYAMSAEMEPLVDGGLSRDDNRKGDLTFSPSERPRANPIPVIIQSVDADDHEALFPTVTISPDPFQG